jgi:hypothetical protein
LNPFVVALLVAVTVSDAPRSWLDEFSACKRATVSAAKTSLPKRSDGTVAVDRAVVLKGHFTVKSAPSILMELTEEDGSASKCQPAAWQWDLVPSGEDQRIEIQLRGKHGPVRFGGTSCFTADRHPPDVVVSGRLKRNGNTPDELERGDIPGQLRIVDARICRP